MELEVLVIGVNQYRFNNRDTGEIVEGTKVTYIDLNQKQTGKGYDVASASIDYDAIDQFEKVPGIYKAKLGMTISGGKPRIRVDSFDFKAPYTFSVKTS